MHFIYSTLCGVACHLIVRFYRVCLQFLLYNLLIDYPPSPTFIYEMESLERDEFIKSFRYISGQLKRKFVRRPNVMEAVEAYGN